MAGCKQEKIAAWDNLTFCSGNNGSNVVMTDNNDKKLYFSKQEELVRELCKNGKVRMLC